MCIGPLDPQNSALSLCPKVSVAHHENNSPTIHGMSSSAQGSATNGVTENNELRALSVDEVVDQLTQAQCASAEETKRILRDITLRLSRAHPSITESALCLLEIHPHVTIPYIADLISDNHEDTTLLLEVYSSLLQTDRTLLVPIIGSLSDINLSSAHMVHMRNTLSFALSIVEQDDLPTIIRALLRCTQNNTSSSSALASVSAASTLKWTCEQVRQNLTDVKPSVLIVISLVLQEYLRCAHGQIGQYFRTVLPAQSSLLHWFDICIWILSLCPRTVSMVPQHETKASIQQAIAKGTLFSCVQLWKLKDQLFVLGELMKQSEHHHAIQKLIIILIVSCPLRLGCVVGCIQLVNQILQHSSLESSTTFLNELSSQLISLYNNHGNVVIPLITQIFTSSSSISSPLSSSSSTAGSKWTNELIKIRKTLVFGYDNSTISKQHCHNQRSTILKILNMIDHAPIVVIIDAINLLHEHVPTSLSERMAVDTLFIANEVMITMRRQGNLVGDDGGNSELKNVEKCLRKVYVERVEKQCTKGWITQCEDLEVKSIGIHEAKSIKIDIGFIWNQPLLSVTNVVCFSVQQLAGDVHFNLLNVCVLVPVVCVSLYEAVDHQKCVNASRYKEDKRRGDEGYEQELTKQVLEMGLNELLKALSSFCVGISIIISVVNMSARQSLDRWKRIVERRASALAHENSDDDRNESTDHRVTWILLERLTEFHRMLNALMLTYNVIAHKSCRRGGRGQGQGKGNIHLDKEASTNILQQQQHDFGRLSSKSKKGRKKSFINTQQEQGIMNRANVIMRNVTETLLSSAEATIFDGQNEHNNEITNYMTDNDNDLLRYRIPSIRLETLIAGLAAVPDDSEMLDEGKTTKANNEDEHGRDTELIEMDKFLLRLLLRTMRENGTPQRESGPVNPLKGTEEYNNTIMKRGDLDKDGAVATSISNSQEEIDSELDFGLSKGLRFDEMSQNDAKALLKDLNKKINEDNTNIFFDDSLSTKCGSDGEDNENADDDDDMLDESEKNITTRQWALGTNLGSNMNNFKVEYIKDCIDSIYRVPRATNNTIQVSEILYSPTFAALLLDRAATCVGLSRQLRGRQSSQGGREAGKGRKAMKTSAEMNDLLTVSGMALSCLMIIIREIVTFYKETDNENDDIWESIHQFVEKVSTHILTSIPERVVQSLVTLDDHEDEKRYGRLFKVLQWIIHTSPDSMISNLACEVVMTLAELDVLPAQISRQCVFKSLITIYELDSAIMDENDLQLMISDGFNSWLCRHRGIASSALPNNSGSVYRKKMNNIFNISTASIFMPMSMKHEDIVDFSSDLPPWITFQDVDSLKNHEYHRLMTYFNGMHVTNALVESLGWVYELTCMKHFKQCDILLDMLGFQPMLTIVLDIVKQGLMACAIDPMISTQQLTEDIVHPLFLSIQLFNDAQHMYNDNQARLMKHPVTETSTKDDKFHCDLINRYISIIQTCHRRIDELNRWHSNEMVDMSQLDQPTLGTIHQFVGLSAKSLMHCYQFAKSIETLATTASTASKKGRKKPAYIHTNQHQTDLSASESRSSKLIPRLGNVCEQLDKSLGSLGGNLGIKSTVKLTSLAPKSISMSIPQKRLVFGVGLDYTSNPGQDTDQPVDEEEEEEDISVKDLGFHTRRPNESAEKEHKENNTTGAPTISFRFRR